MGSGRSSEAVGVIEGFLLSAACMGLPLAGLVDLLLLSVEQSSTLTWTRGDRRRIVLADDGDGCSDLSCIPNGGFESASNKSSSLSTMRSGGRGSNTSESLSDSERMERFSGIEVQSEERSIRSPSSLP